MEKNNQIRKDIQNIIKNNLSGHSMQNLDVGIVWSCNAPVPLELISKQIETYIDAIMTLFYSSNNSIESACSAYDYYLDDGSSCDWYAMRDAIKAASIQALNQYEAGDG